MKSHYGRSLTYATVCSGIEAMSVAVSGLGFRPVFFSEIEPVLNSFLETTYKGIPNLGDLSGIRAAEEKAYGNNISVDCGDLTILAGGTPCQDVSTVGTLAGMSEGSRTRSSLVFEFARVCSEILPRWILWENVEGCVKGKAIADFRKFVGRIVGCGYDVAWRVIDSSAYGIPQARRRVWLVGHRADLGAGTDGPVRILFRHKMPAGVPSAPHGPEKEPGPASHVGPRVCVDLYNGRITGKVACTFGANSFGTNTAGPKLMVPGRGFRRFTVTETERLFGFPDGYTSPLGRASVRCRALGNSWPVPVARALVSEIMRIETECGAK